MHLRSGDSLRIETNSSRASDVLPAIVMIVALMSASAAWGLGFSLAPGGGWEVVPSPNGGPQPEGNVLLATVALSSTDVWAVGAEPNPNQYLTATLAEHWDGTQWSIVDTPRIPALTVQLNSIVAVDTNDVWAAGYALPHPCICEDTVIEHWDGTSWTRVPSPNPGIANLLYGIAAVSDADLWAVGYEWISRSTWAPLILHYDGKSWSLFDQSQLEFGILSSIFALAMDDVWAVGSIGVGDALGLVLHWDGTSWTRVSLPMEPGGSTLLKSVSGAATNDVWAVGSYHFINISGQTESRARIYHWDGLSWTRDVTVGLGGYSYWTSVMAKATDDVWVVGAGIVHFPNYSYVTFHWDGSSWSNVENPNEGILNAVSASSSSDVWAVGLGFVTYGTHTIHYTVP